MIEAASRLQGVEQLIDMKQFFFIHAARQSGKTTYLKELAQRLNEAGNYYVLYCSLEGLQGIDDIEKGIPKIVKTIKRMLRFSAIPFKEKTLLRANAPIVCPVLPLIPCGARWRYNLPNR